MSGWSDQEFQGIVPCAGISYDVTDWLELQSSSGIKLMTYRNHCENPQALVFIFHCWYAASSSYSHLARKFQQSNFAVFAFDQEGHGKSGGTRGEIRDINNNISLGVEFIEKTRKLYSNLPVFIIGESMGGLTCAGISLRIPEIVKGMILLAPALGFTPKFYAQGWSDDFDWNNPVVYSSNPRLMEWWAQNPDTYLGKTTTGTSDAFTRGANEVQQRAGESRTPFIIFHGDNDQVCPVSASREFFNNSGATDKEFAYDASLYHLVSFESQFPQILDRIVTWIQERI